MENKSVSFASRQQLLIVNSRLLFSLLSWLLCDQVCTLEIRETVINHVRNDDLSLKVLGRLQSYCDLVAEEAVYNNTCLSYFLQNKNLAAMRSDLGCPQDDAMCEAFEQLCDLLESSCENDLSSIDQLHQCMTDIMQSEQVLNVACRFFCLRFWAFLPV